MEDQKQQIKDLRIEIGNLEDKVAALSKENETFKRDNNRWSGQVNDPTLSMPLNFRNKQAINTHVAYPIRHSLTGTEPATAGNYEVFFTADYPCEVVSVSEVHRVLGTDGSAVTLNIEKLTSGQALDAGTAILTTALSLKTTINVPQFGILVSTGARVLARGDRLALVDAGTLTAVAGLTVTVYIKQI